MTLNEDFEETLRKLEDARNADDELHRRSAPLEDRVASHERLTELRSEIAQIRRSLGMATPNVSGSHDSRTARSTAGY